MPFHVIIALVYFIKLVNNLMGEYLDQFVLVFVDDILVYYSLTEQHPEEL